MRSTVERIGDAAAADGANLPVFLQSPRLKPFISDKLAMELSVLALGHVRTGKDFERKLTFHGGTQVRTSTDARRHARRLPHSRRALASVSAQFAVRHRKPIRRRGPANAA